MTDKIDYTALIELQREFYQSQIEDIKKTIFELKDSLKTVKACLENIAIKQASIESMLHTPPCTKTIECEKEIKTLLSKAEKDLRKILDDIEESVEEHKKNHIGMWKIILTAIGTFITLLVAVLAIFKEFFH